MSENHRRVLSVAIVIPNLESPVIAAVLAGLSRQTVGAQRLEIVVVGRDDGGHIPAGARARVIETPGAVIAAVARNIGIRATAAPVVICLDADCVPPPDWVDRLLALRERGHRVIGGAVRFPGGGYWAHADHVASYHVLLPEEPEGPRHRLPLGGSSLLVDRELLDRYGLFDETLPQGEDAELVARLRAAGHPAYYAASVAVDHHSWVRTFGDAVRHALHYGRAMTIPVRLKHIESSFLWEHPWLFLALLPLRALATPTRLVLERRAMWKYLPLWPAMVVLYAVRYWSAFRALTQPLALAPTSAPPAPQEAHVP